MFHLKLMRSLRTGNLVLARNAQFLAFFSFALLPLFFLSPSLAKADSSASPHPPVNENFQRELLNKLISSTPGSVIELPEGTFHLDTQLSLMTDDVTIRGKGMNKTVLNFINQQVGAEGLVITSNGIILEDFTIQDTKGDAIKITNSDGVTIRRVKTEWTGGPKTENGAYGFYPVQSNNVLIEDSVAIGASDAGIYVGQSTNIIVRRNFVSHNVAGIEIENSVHADVYENEATENTGGILVFNMPDLELPGSKTRIFNNKIYSNNTPNFAPSKNTVADLPTGTGIMVTANKNVEIFQNRIDEHQTAGLLIVSYLITGRPIQDPNYDPYPEGLFVYNNSFGRSGYAPQGGSSEDTQVLIEFLKQVIGTPFPHIVYDGSFDPKKLVNGSIPDALRLCVQGNDGATFINLDALREFQNMSRELAPFDCVHEKLPEISFPIPKVN